MILEIFWGLTFLFGLWVSGTAFLSLVTLGYFEAGIVAIFGLTLVQVAFAKFRMYMGDHSSVEVNLFGIVPTRFTNDYNWRKMMDSAFGMDFMSSQQDIRPISGSRSIR